MNRPPSVLAVDTVRTGSLLQDGPPTLFFFFSHSLQFPSALPTYSKIRINYQDVSSPLLNFYPCLLFFNSPPPNPQATERGDFKKMRGTNKLISNIFPLSETVNIMTNVYCIWRGVGDFSGKWKSLNSYIQALSPGRRISLRTLRPRTTSSPCPRAWDWNCSCPPPSCTPPAPHTAYPYTIELQSIFFYYTPKLLNR